MRRIVSFNSSSRPPLLSSPFLRELATDDVEMGGVVCYVTRIGLLFYNEGLFISQTSSNQLRVACGNMMFDPTFFASFQGAFFCRRKTHALHRTNGSRTNPAKTHVTHALLHHYVLDKTGLISRGRQALLKFKEQQISRAFTTCKKN